MVNGTARRIIMLFFSNKNKPLTLNQIIIGTLNFHKDRENIKYICDELIKINLLTSSKQKSGRRLIIYKLKNPPKYERNDKKITREKVRNYRIR